MSANVLKTFATTIISTSNMITTIAVRSNSILDHALGSLDDLAGNMHDYTSMNKLSDMTRRRKVFMEDNKDLENNIPPSLQALLDMEVK